MSETHSIGLGTNAGSPGRQAWFPPTLPLTTSAHRVFCFAYAGGSASIYRDWAAALGPGYDVCPVELPGHWLRFQERPYTSMDALQADLLPALLPYMSQPFSLFGYSLGALIAYLLACNLERHGVVPHHLFAAAAKPPHIPRARRLAGVSDAELLAALAELYAPIPQQIQNEPELLAMVMRITRADFCILESFDRRAAHSLRCPITAFGGDSDKGVDREALLEWQQLSTGPFALQTFRGDHFFINQSGPQLTAAVRAALAGRA
jgi:medium-chain acyl-[acyl-carrier-protein] hydrolase